MPNLYRKKREKGRDELGGNYEKQLFRQMQETLEYVDILSNQQETGMGAGNDKASA